MKRTELIEAHGEAARALEAGVRLAGRAASLRRRDPNPVARPDGAALGKLLADPAAFWGAAAASAIGGDGSSVEALVLENRLTAARASCGDMGFVRDSLIGQAQWLSVLALHLSNEFEAARDPAVKTKFMTLALQAQRQAAQTLASIAALHKLETADEIRITD